MIKFSYPNAAAPTTEVVLSGDIESLPHSRPIRRYQAAFDTDSGKQLIYDWGGSTRVFNVTLYPMLESEKDALQSFFDVTANGRVETFDFTDALDDVYHVRFAMDVFEGSMLQPTLWQVIATMRSA